MIPHLKKLSLDWMTRVAASCCRLTGPGLSADPGLGLVTDDGHSRILSLTSV